MDAQTIFAHVVARFGDAAYDLQPGAPGSSGFKVKADHLLNVMAHLRDDALLRFDFLQNVTAVDWPKEERLQSVYHLFSYPHRHDITVKVDVPRQAPRMPSVTALWKCADWLEREQYDLLGIIYEGHPDLRRLLMPDDWLGHPMRKDYQEATEYRGMPTTRPSPMELIFAYDKAHRKAVTPEGDKP